MNILLDTNYVEVSHDPVIKLGKIIWKGSFTPDEYKTAFITLLDYAETHTTDLFLSDTRKQGVVGPDTRKWFEAEAMPRAIKCGLKRAAVITDANVFKKYYLNVLLSATNKFGLPMKIVSSEEDALHWLLKG